MFVVNKPIPVIAEVGEVTDAAGARKSPIRLLNTLSVVVTSVTCKPVTD